jgi:hypothetical protein
VALKNIHFDSVIRGILQSRPDSLHSLLEAATKKLAEIGLEANPQKAVSSVAVHKRGANKGQPKGSDNFNGLSLLGWIDSVPAVVPGEPASPEVLDAQDKLVAIHATLAARVS